MKQIAVKEAKERQDFRFDMVRLSKSKELCDVSSNTLRTYAREGRLRLYRTGKAVWFSKSEFEALIRGGIAVSSRANLGRGAADLPFNGQQLNQFSTP